MAGKSDGNKNMLIGALIVIVLGLGFVLVKKSQDKKGISIEVSESGLSIEEN